MPQPRAHNKHARIDDDAALQTPASSNEILGNGGAPHHPLLSQDHLDVLAALRQDCRIKHTDLARRQGWPVSTTHERMGRYAKRSVTRHTCLLDFKALGFTCRTIWIVKPHRRDEWLASASRILQLNTLCRTHAGDFIAESVCRDSEEENAVRALLSRGAVIVSNHTILDDIKTEAAFASAGTLPAFRPAAEHLTAKQ